MMPCITVDMAVIVEWSAWVVAVVVMWIIAPVVWRPVRHVWMRAPPPIEYHWAINVRRNDNVILAVNVWVTHDGDSHVALLCDGIRARRLDEQSGDILIKVLAKDSLNKDITLVILDHFDHSQVVNVPVIIEVKVGNWVLRVVDGTLERLKIVRFAKGSSHRLKVQVVGNSIVTCGDSDSACNLLRISKEQCADKSQ